MFIQSPESQNNSPDKNTFDFIFFTYPLEMFQAAADFRFRKRHHSQLAKEQKRTRMPFGRTRSLQVISIWCSEWQQEQFPHCLCWMNTEWLVKLQEAVEMSISHEHDAKKGALNVRRSLWCLMLFDWIWHRKVYFREILKLTQHTWVCTLTIMNRQVDFTNVLGSAQMNFDRAAIYKQLIICLCSLSLIWDYQSDSKAI